MNINQNDTIGIWGYGEVGKSLVQFFTQHKCTLYVMDKNKEIEEDLKKDFPGVVFFHEFEKEEVSNFFSPFFISTTLICPSPGVDISFYYQNFREKFKTEVDLFFEQWNKPIIAVTGSVGKTTVVSFLSSLLHAYNTSITTGGNIGIPLLNLLQSLATYAVIELSSFQLEYCTAFHPTIAVWTNFHPNHLDRHKNKESYFKAKYQLLMRQTKDELAIVPTSLIPYFEIYGWPKSRLFFIQDEEKYSQSVINHYPLFLCKDNITYYIDQHVIKKLLPMEKLPATTISQNWLTLIAILHVMNLFDDTFTEYAQQLQPIPHRTEYVATINGISFINDSKSTTIASTLAAIEKYKDKHIILIVGGLSKGVDRTPLFMQMPANVTCVITFGAEAMQLYTICQQYRIVSFACTNLKEAIEKSFSIASLDSIVLFSPAGSSYDLFKNYEERGVFFKNIIKRYQSKPILKN